VVALREGPTIQTMRRKRVVIIKPGGREGAPVWRDCWEAAFEYAVSGQDIPEEMRAPMFGI